MAGKVLDSVTIRKEYHIFFSKCSLSNKPPFNFWKAKQYLYQYTQTYNEVKSKSLNVFKYKMYVKLKREMVQSKGVHTNYENPSNMMIERWNLKQ